MDKFFTTRLFELSKKREILEDAKLKCDNDWSVNILDCTKSCTRQGIEMDWETIMSKLDDTCHFVIIHRIREFYIEFGFCEMHDEPNLFLFVNVDEKYLNYFIDKYNLKEL